MFRKKNLILMFLALVFCGGWQALADTPPLISYQGYLTDSDGPVTGSRTMVFSIYSVESGGEALWSSGEISVDVEGGYFYYMLGGESGVPAICFDGPDRWLGVQVLPDDEIIPRTRLTAVPYAYCSRHSDTANYGLSGGGWSSLSGVVGLANGLDNVGIGTDVPLGKLHVATEGRPETPFVVTHDGDTKFIVKTSGNIGMGTDSPLNRLHIQGNSLSISSAQAGADLVIEDTDAGIQLFSAPDGIASGAFELVQIDAGTLIDKWAIVRETPTADYGGNGLRITYGSNNNVFNNPTRFRIDADGDVGIGSANPQDHRLYVTSSATPYSTAFFKNTNSAGISAWCENESSQPPLIVLNRGSGDIITGHSGAWAEKVFSVKNNGEVECSVLRLTGGSDIAEPFEISGAEVLPEGSIAIIDDTQPGKLKLSYRAYDTRVAGIVSGAGGVKPGIMMTQEKRFTGEQHIAISGRVYSLVDASYGAIKPGDLLTTSPTPGHAMKATDRGQAYGAVIGKAMSGLEDGKGLVLVLVNLQ